MASGISLLAPRFSWDVVELESTCALKVYIDPLARSLECQVEGMTAGSRQVPAEPIHACGGQGLTNCRGKHPWVAQLEPGLPLDLSKAGHLACAPYGAAHGELVGA